MDFTDQLQQFSQRVKNIKKEKILTEEATKMSLIVPFFQMLGYDIFNPCEFAPEFTTDVGIKKGEKIDYAIMKNNTPAILIECKSCTEILDRHASQLFRYFGVSTAKFGILTNGFIYRFFTDLEEINKMDLTPFLEINILDIKPFQVTELKKFTKNGFDIDNIFSSASELKYSKSIKEHFNEQLKNPSDDFIKYFLSKIYTGIKTQSIVDKYKNIVQKSLNDYISEIMNEKITSALKNDEIASTSTFIPVHHINQDTKSESKIATNTDELQAYYIIKSLLHEIVPVSDITYKDTENYLNILYQSNTRKTICRLNLDTQKKYLIILKSEKTKYKQSACTKYQIHSIDDLYNYKKVLIESVSRFLC